jgi:DNA repair protein RadC
MCAVLGFIVLLVLLISLAMRPTTRVRRKRLPAFKRRYDLDRRQPLDGFEQKLAMAMFSVQREVWVTVFCNESEVLAVTATIGSKYRCRPSDKIHNWGPRARRLGATQIRQYHNHPDIWGRSTPSTQDWNSNRYMRRCVEPYGIRMHTLLIYKPWFGGFKVQEYR